MHVCDIAGEEPIGGKTDLNPEGLTGAYGKHAPALAERLARGGLSCKVWNEGGDGDRAVTS